MKKLFYAAVVLLTTIAISTSCGVNGDDVDIYTTIATVVEGDSTIPYYVEFDDGKKAYVTNSKEWSPSFSESVRELRYIVAYEIVNEKSSIYDLDIKLVETSPIYTQTGGLKFVSAVDFTGDKGLQNYTAGASVEACVLSQGRNYITLIVLFNGTTAYGGAPKMTLVFNTDRENSPYKELYKDDGYLYLELYHDNSNYKGEQELSTYLSCQMPVNVNDITKDFSGVKILSMDYKTMLPTEYKFNFTTGEQTPMN